ncbi:MAG TPA: Sulphatase-modifying factor protein [Cyanobacteria bacterium UBA11369]|nr:Sulphatase-modifying factor protein [Cyanobacteria bacterium UBA11371]HBE33931.1 Sulphatase-modifying factor protein [Cyanobacteria bacterium UBA11368]HBE53242.1 Sulphatase-modifying factor protein [Cyanobacteria bacterium UBA11369]
MAENPDQPREYDAVLGGQNLPPPYAVVLGGIEGARKRFASTVVEVRSKAVADAIKYGDPGLDLVLSALQDESIQVRYTAYSLLKDRQEPRIKQQVDKILPIFAFDLVTVDIFGQINSSRLDYAEYFIEDLGNGVFLEMISIPGGNFMMGSPPTETGRDNSEVPQHSVTVPPFFMGKYPVTQAQWNAVAALPQINLPLHPNPSYTKGKNQPVEQVSWHEAEEFCARISQKTGKIYRLPSESEWEYAARGGTTTPFYFGATITGELANFDGHSAYGFAPKGVDRQETTPVDSFPPNAFGLYDMHGNVWEWCADVWHDNYYGAPTDGSAWDKNGNNRYRLVRGGSWYDTPKSCRSANRCASESISKVNNCGFRLVAVS